MKTPLAILLTLTGLTLVAPLWLSSNARADDQNGAVDYFGEIEGGMRILADPPQRDGRAKFNEYRDLDTGPVLEHLHLGAAANNGGFLFEFWSQNAGWDDQHFRGQFSKPGNAYLTLDWDEIPHNTSSSALTLFDTSNAAALTVPDAIRASLEAGPAAANLTTIDNAVQPIELKTQREIGTVGLRYTPGPAWDFQFNYSNDKKTGTQAFGTSNNGFTGAIELPAPISFTTENFDASGQYFGTYGDNKHWSANFGYQGSLFYNEFESFTWDNPFRLSAPAGNNTANEGRNSLPPDNQAHQYTFTGALDLPRNARYVGTVSYGQMKQNRPFLPKTINPTLVTTPLPATSLNGEIDTLLVNNVLTGRIKPNVTGKLAYRYYDINNKTPELFFADYVRADGQVRSGANGNRTALSLAYIKQNADAEVKWRKGPGLSVGTAFGWERYDRDRRDADITDEYTGKVFADTTLADWLILRGRILHGRRRYNKYSNAELVGNLTHPLNPTAITQKEEMRKFDMADRDRTEAKLTAEIDVSSTLLISPTFGWRHDRLSDGKLGGPDPLLGLKRDDVLTAGVELAFPLGARTTVVTDYTFERFNRSLVNRQNVTFGGSPTPNDPSSNWGSKMNDHVHTLSAAVDRELIPDKLDLRLGWIHTRSYSVTDTFPLGSGGLTSNPPFPDVTTIYNRLEAELGYKLKQDDGSGEGVVDEAVLKLRYAYENNEVTDWQIDGVVPYMINTDSGAASTLFLASINPEYDAHIVEMVLAMKW